MTAEQLVELLQKVCEEHGVPARLDVYFDNDDQLVIYTNLEENFDGDLVEFNPT